ncbi:MAG: ClpXP protease specificity-enhancing factor [Rhodanobacteraceae bacterium]
MTSNRPYLLRAMHEWIGDNGMTPYVVVDASFAGVRVPPQAIREGRVVLNVALRAVANLDLGNERIRCMARFGGVSQPVELPIAAVQAIYAHENGQGMMFPQEDSAPVEHAAESGTVETQTAMQPDSSDEPPPKGPPKLRVVK